MTGKTITHYQILEKLGEGAMGMVYKAKDLNLNRIVALKFLHATSMEEKSKRAFILQEAQAAAAINHTNICTVYEIVETKSVPGESDGEIFFSMEYVEGQNLKEKIQSEPLEIENAINIAIQICEGLLEIHDKGMVHRDIKSENIRITNKGQIKIMDFGLAKSSGIKDKIAKDDSISGTLAYMSPEQIRGGVIDKRSDIWSLGIVLYEMLSHKLPFRSGKDGTTIIYSILDEKPEVIQNLHPVISTDLLSTLNCTLEKDPDSRYQNVNEILKDLKRMKSELLNTNHSEDSGPINSESIMVPESLRKPRIVNGAIVLCLLAIIIVLLLVFRSFKSTSEPQVSVLTSYIGSEGMPALSPDGNKLAFIWGGDSANGNDIYIKLIGETDYFRLTASYNGIYTYRPVWSPDGNTIAYLQGDIKGNETGIYAKPIFKGRETLLISLDSSLFMGDVYVGFDWSWDGKWLVYNNFDAAEKKHCLFRMNIETREKEQLTHPQADYLGDMYPRFSPDGKQIAFVRVPSQGIGDLHIIKLKNKQVNQLTYDKKHIHNLAWLPNSREIVFCSNRDGTNRLWKISGRRAKPEVLSIGGDPEEISISRSGDRLIYSAGVYDFDIWRADLSLFMDEIIEPCKFIVSTKEDVFGVFSPDGNRIAFASGRNGNGEIWTCNMDGSNPIPITSLNASSGVPQWSPNGQRIVFDAAPQGNRDILLVDANGVDPSWQLINDPSEDINPTWSQDGQWIYFGSNRTGDYEIFKTRAERNEDKEIIQITTNGGFVGYESPDSKYLYFRKHKPFLGPIYSVDLEKSEEIIVINEKIDKGRWIVATEGIYYILSNPTGDPILKFYSFSSARIEQVGYIKEWHLRLSDISDDGKTMLLWKMEASHDIYMVENFKQY